jgi:hypothetical protein
MQALRGEYSFLAICPAAANSGKRRSTVMAVVNIVDSIHQQSLIAEQAHACTIRCQQGPAALKSLDDVMATCNLQQR